MRTEQTAIHGAIRVGNKKKYRETTEAFNWKKHESEADRNREKDESEIYMGKPLYLLIML